MKKLHLLVSKDSLRPHLQYIQLKNGFCYATNCHIMAKIDAEEVFGKGINMNEEVYFNAEQWKKQNFHKASYFGRDGMIFKAYNLKRELLGMIEAKNADDFTQNVGRFPNCDQVIPTSELQPIDRLAFSHEFYANLIECLTDGSEQYRMEFRGETKPILLRNATNKESKNIGIIMPIYVREWAE